MVDPADVCVLVPTYDEAETIGEVISGFREQGFETLLVADGGSTDGTRDIAREHGARVFVQSGSGKGQAIREALTEIEQPYVLMLDGDGTYRPDQAERLLEPLFQGRAEHVVGNRFADMDSGAMTRLNRFGNGLINRSFRWIHGRDFADILSGYRAFTVESARTMSLTADGFGIETEMAVECVKQGIPTAVVPITYETRPDESEANLRPFRDGAVILLTVYSMARTNNPLFYFGSVGVLSSLVGLVLAAYVGIEWLTLGISHEVIAVVAGVAILFGVQLLMFGVLSDLVVTINREQTAQFKRLARAMTEEEEPAAVPIDTSHRQEEAAGVDDSSPESRTGSSGDDHGAPSTTPDGGTANDRP